MKQQHKRLFPAAKGEWIVLAGAVLVFLAGCASGSGAVVPADTQPAATSAAAPATPPAATPAAAPARELPVTSYALNAFKPELDGQWECSIAASDGNVYFASSTHSGAQGGCFFKYNPNTKALTCLSKDITEVCGEDPKVNPQGKLHSPIVEANGWLYFATHFSSERPGAAATYTGAHALGYELATGKFRDFGVVHPGYTIYSAVGVDPQRNVLYVHTTPISGEQVRLGGVSRLYRIDIASGKKEEVVKLGAGLETANFWFFIDRRGDCWFTHTGDPATLFGVRAATGKVDKFENALPKRYLLTAEKVAPDDKQERRYWSWAQALPGGDRCVFATDKDGMLWTFDATKLPPGSTPGATDLAKAFTPVKFIGSTGLGMALAGGRVWYMQRANGAPGTKSRGAPDLHLLSVSLDPKSAYAITDHGLITDQDGRHPWRIEALSADGKGKVFMTGDWRLKPGESGTMRYAFRGGKDTWQAAGFEAAPRGQFFSVADVAGDLK